MTRLKLLTRGSDRVPACYAEDVRRLQETLPDVLAGLTRSQVRRLYHHYSEVNYRAGWLMMNDGVIQDLKRWLLEDVDELEGMC